MSTPWVDVLLLALALGVLRPCAGPGWAGLPLIGWLATLPALALARCAGRSASRGCSPCSPYLWGPWPQGTTNATPGLCCSRSVPKIPRRGTVPPAAGTVAWLGGRLGERPDAWQSQAFSFSFPELAHRLHRSVALAKDGMWAPCWWWSVSSPDGALTADRRQAPTLRGHWWCRIGRWYVQVVVNIFMRIGLGPVTGNPCLE